MRSHNPEDHVHRDGLHETDSRTEYLRELRSLLASLDCSAEPIQLGPGTSGLRVSHPHHPSGSADIACVRRDGEWWFTWAGGKAIGPAEDLGGVAVAIFRTLRDGPVPS